MLVVLGTALALAVWLVRPGTGHSADCFGGQAEVPLTVFGPARTHTAPEIMGSRQLQVFFDIVDLLLSF